MLLTTVKAVGIAFEITFFKNCPFILSLFGSSANTNDGIPIVTMLINVKWIGINGYGILAIKKTMANILAYIVFTKNKLADLCILLIVRLPSSTILGIEAKLESNNTS